jgi:hypothetical protein
VCCLRRCPGEQQLAARQSLYILTADLANRGLSLWCVAKQVLGMNANQTVFDLPVGHRGRSGRAVPHEDGPHGSTISGSGWQGLDLGSW